MVMLFPSFYPSVKKKADKKSPDPYSSIKFLAEIRIPTSFSTIPVQDHPQLEWMASTITDPNFPQQLTFLSRITPSLNEWHQRSQQCLHKCINTQPLLKVLCVLIYIYMIIISMLPSTSSTGKCTYHQSQIKSLNTYCSYIFFTISTWKGHLQMKQDLLSSETIGKSS